MKLHPSVENVEVDQTPPFTKEEIEQFYLEHILVGGQYIPRGKFDEELNVRDFYFTPEQIDLLMDLLHTLGGEERVDALYQELTSQINYHPDQIPH